MATLYYFFFNDNHGYQYYDYDPDITLVCFPNDDDPPGRLWNKILGLTGKKKLSLAPANDNFFNVSLLLTPLSRDFPCLQTSNPSSQLVLDYSKSSYMDDSSK